MSLCSCPFYRLRNDSHFTPEMDLALQAYHPLMRVFLGCIDAPSDHTHDACLMKSEAALVFTGISGQSGDSVRENGATTPDSWRDWGESSPQFKRQGSRERVRRSPRSRLGMTDP